MSKDKITDHDRRLASAWLDQELPESDRDYIESRLVSGDEPLKQEIDSFRFIRSELRDWFETEVAVGARSVDYWSKIQHRLKVSAPLSWRDRLEEFVLRFRGNGFRVTAFATACAAAAVAITLARTSQQPLELAQREALQIEHLQNDHSSVAEPSALVLTAGAGPQSPLARSAKDLPLQLPVPEALAVKLLSSPQLIVGNDIPGGFRSGETDIEWIKTDRPFRLVSAKKQEAPPVIWVANRRR